MDLLIHQQQSTGVVGISYYNNLTTKEMRMEATPSYLERFRTGSSEIRFNLTVHNKNMDVCTKSHSFFR